MKSILILLFTVFTAFLFSQEQSKTYRIMAVGDSITEGGPSFSVYRYPLGKKLKESGYSFIFVGTKSSSSPDGLLAHEGYSGKNAEFIATQAEAHFSQTPADIVLLHAAHNYSVEEEPIPKILAATESMIATFRKVNPHVVVLVARPIPSAKLPKYSYLPGLGSELQKLVERLNRPDQPVILVDQFTGFDPQKDTIVDQVHPNEKGAEKMAQRWFEALEKILLK